MKKLEKHTYPFGFGGVSTSCSELLTFEICLAFIIFYQSLVCLLLCVVMCWQFRPILFTVYSLVSIPEFQFSLSFVLPP